MLISAIPDTSSGNTIPISNRFSDKLGHFTNPILFFAREREIADEAFPGDIIGIPNHGTLRVGDTLSEGTETTITGLPNFAPEILRRVALKDPTKTKQLRKALSDLAEEGITQVFFPDIGSQWMGERGDRRRRRAVAAGGPHFAPRSRI